MPCSLQRASCSLQPATCSHGFPLTSYFPCGKFIRFRPWLQAAEKQDLRHKGVGAVLQKGAGEPFEEPWLQAAGKQGFRHVEAGALIEALR